MNFVTCITFFPLFPKPNLHTWETLLTCRHRHTLISKFWWPKTDKKLKKYRMKIACIYRFRNFICLLIAWLCVCFYFGRYLPTYTCKFSSPLGDFRWTIVFKDEYTYKKKQSFPKSAELIAGMLLSHGNRSYPYTWCARWGTPTYW